MRRCGENRSLTSGAACFAALLRRPLLNTLYPRDTEDRMLPSAYRAAS
ncbi:hypothetical protein NDS46_12070 [Paenibacillus thiaminolyticus]|nr:hypothetical protein [Paenibacillus thiaminolyticus]WCF10529.1 hypothetical protein NDS46_12070 [Paenibacillus thiaminolyticus]